MRREDGDDDEEEEEDWHMRDIRIKWEDATAASTILRIKVG
jgi:hypothetical protein